MIKDQIKIYINDALYVENKVWIVAKNFSCLFCMDLNSKKIEYMGVIPESPYYKVNSFLQIRFFNNKIYCVPYNAKSIVVYDVIKNTFEIIEIDQKIIQYKGVGGLFSGAKAYGKYLFLLPAFCKVIIRLNMETHELTYVTEWVEQIGDLVFDENEYYFLRQSVIKGDKLFVPFVNANAILELDCVDLKSNIYILGNENKGYSGITYDGESFWMSVRMLGELVSWNPKTNKIMKVCLNQGKEKGHWHDYIGITYYSNAVELFPILEENRVEKKENIVKKNGQYLFVKEEDNVILYYEEINGELIIIDKEKNIENRLEIVVEEKLINLELIFKENEILLETDEIGLKTILLKLKN